MSEREQSQKKFVTSQHCLDGILYPPMVSPEAHEKAKTIATRPNDIILACYPKSGTHWILKILTLLLHKENDEYINYVPQIYKDFYWLQLGAVEGIPGDLFDAIPGPRIIFSHGYYNTVPGGPPNTTQAKYITCNRNPKDAALSLYHHYKKRTEDVNFDLSWDEFVDHFLRGEVSFASWWDHVPEWWSHRDEPNVLFLKYEDMKKDLTVSVRTIAHFLGCHINEETVQKIAKATTIDSMKANSAEWIDQHFLRKGVVGDWKNQFTQAQSEAMDVAYHKAIQGTGLEFDFE